MKARHLRAASEDLSSSLGSTARHADIAVVGSPAAQLNVAIDSENSTSDRNGRASDPSENDASWRIDVDLDEPTSRFPERDAAFASSCGENVVDRRGSGTKPGHAFSDDTAVDCSLRRCSNYVDGDDEQSQPATTEDVDVVDFTGDDVGYFSLPGRRLDKDGRRRSERCRSHSWNVRKNSAIVDDDGVESPMTFKSDWIGCLSPGLRTGRDQHVRAEVSSCIDGCPSDEAPRDHISTSSYPVFSDGQ